MKHHIIDDSQFLPEKNFFTQTIGYIQTIYHGHSFYEFFYIVSGEINHVINNRSEKLKSGDLCLIRPGDYHMFTEEHSDDFLHTDILVKPELFESIVSFLGKDLIKDILSAEEPIKIHLTLNEISVMEQYLQAMNISPSDELSELIQKSLITHLIYNIVKAPFPKSVSAKPLWLKQLLSMLEFGNTIAKAKDEVFNLLNTLSYNKSYISRAFKNYMGKTLTQYINDLRFTSAYNLLRSTNESIDDIMQSIGLTNKSYFYREFQKRYHTTPRKIRTSSKF